MSSKGAFWQDNCAAPAACSCQKSQFLPSIPTLHPILSLHSEYYIAKADLAKAQTHKGKNKSRRRRKKGVIEHQGYWNWGVRTLCAGRRRVNSSLCQPYTAFCLTWGWWGLLLCDEYTQASEEMEKKLQWARNAKVYSESSPRRWVSLHRVPR